MRVPNLKRVVVAMGFFLAVGTMAVPVYAHGWKDGGWKAPHWAMHHPFKARRFAMMRNRRMNMFRQRNPYFQGNPGLQQQWARNGYGYAGYGGPEGEGNEGRGYYNGGYGSPLFNGGYYGPGNWGNFMGGGYYGPGNMFGRGGDDDGD